MAVTEQVAKAVYKRSRGKCEICGLHEFRNDQFQLNHCIHHKSIHFPEFDVEENLQLCHRTCHDKRGHSKENKKTFWKRQIAHYGDKHMRDWEMSLPIKTHEWFD